MPQCESEAIVEDGSLVHMFSMRCRLEKGHEGYHWYSPTNDGETWQMFWKDQKQANLNLVA